MSIAALCEHFTEGEILRAAEVLRSRDVPGVALGWWGAGA
ncbi:hypothetical protein Save01_00303 [Streptomyces avermitilis]